MSRFKFFSYNWIEQDFVDLTIDDPANEDSFFPLSNIKHPFSTKVFRSSDGVTTVSFIIDLKTSAPIDTILLKGHAIDGLGVNSVLLEASGTLDFSSPGLSENLTLNHEYNLGYKFFNEQSFRYWKITLQNTSDYCELGNVFLGQATYLVSNNLDYNWKYMNVDRSKIDENRYGQRFVDKLNSQRMIEGVFNYLNKNEFETLNEIFDLHGKNKPLWAIIDSEGIIINEMETFAGQFYFQDRPEIINVAFGLYQATLKLVEAT
jgi:hypothetical protein